jgi:hypothetical protein
MSDLSGSSSEWSSRAKVIQLINGGIMALAVGGAFFYTDRSQQIAAILTAVGLAMLVSAIVSYLLARKWGLIGSSEDTAEPKIVQR